MKKRTKLDDKIIKDFLLTEAPGDDDDLFGGDDEPEDAEEDTAEEDTGEEESDEEESDEEESDEEESDEEEKEEPESKSFLDSEIDAVLIDYESKARKEESENRETNEANLYRSGLNLLLEDTESGEIDMEIFASEIARLVKNYDNLLDMKSLLVDKAANFISSRYDEDHADELRDLLDTIHGVSIEKDSEESELPAPIAVGAMPGTA